MEKAVAYLVGHPVLFIIAVIISIMILFSFLRRVMRLFFVVAAMLILYAAWLHFTGGNIHQSFHHIEQGFQSVIHVVGELFKFLLDFLKSPQKGGV
ncbi:hypothetical protein [Pelodictyon phaeoclathratiforme]|jgi:hypothetical protein|uniref:Uncharacterized protein n=1 Tax=Pelodictyon phaeoclathratiforme (strain DSM 5477 / BU-1) TaxID=324925 RepID=B4SCT6_PELPB|nr:hypothetical protein [Pelodictyon phaeoclathratiforme]ACF42770.1 conserved hypothetical protein [Pelodictyon phaeoclathratiforme BU-1]MBV5289741.1 hypothetical protein [Pelodictyon phaeoclathratiforme]